MKLSMEWYISYKAFGYFLTTIQNLKQKVPSFGKYQIFPERLKDNTHRNIIFMTSLYATHDAKR